MKQTPSTVTHAGLSHTTESGGGLPVPEPRDPPAVMQ